MDSRLSGSGGAGVEGAVVGEAARLEQRDAVERIAELVAERVVVELRVRPRAHGELIDAREVARILGCQRSIYEHKAELPLVRLGSGARPRLRFDRAKVEAMAGLVDRDAGTTRRRDGRRRQRRTAPTRLLEIKRPAP